MIKHGTWSSYTHHKCRCDICRAKATEYQRERRKNRPDVVEQNRKNSARYMNEQRQYLNTVKNKPCTDCKVKYPPYVMHFDHLGIEPKLFTISRIKSREKLDAEIAKCEVVCSNCHAIRTWKRRKGIAI